jgi:DNA-binding PucR family transcriptional regulator
VRYRLRRIGEITGHSPTDPRDSFVLRTALVISRLQTWSEPPSIQG